MVIYGLVVAFLCILFFYVLGSILVWFFRPKVEEKEFYDTFIRLVIGFLLTVFITSSVKTSGKTINLSLLIVGFIYFFSERKSIYINYFLDYSKIFQFRKNLNPILIILVFVTIIYSFYALCYFNKPFNNILHYDDVFYTFLSSKMWLFGAESTFPSFGENKIINLVPYHYSELWVTSLISHFFNLNPMLTHSVILKSSFTAILMVGMLTLTELFTSKKIYYLFAFCSVFIAPLLLDYTHITQKGSNAFPLKIIAVSLIFVWFAILTKKKSKHWFIPLLVLPILNIAYSIIVFSTLFIISVVNFVKDKSFKKFLNIQLSLTAVTLFFLIFYSFQEIGEDVDSGTLPSITDYYVFKFFIDGTISHIKNILIYSVYFFPLGLLIVYFYFKRNNQLKSLYSDNNILFLYVFISFVVGNIVQFIIYPLAGPNSGQMNQINYIVPLNIAVYFSFLIVEESIHLKEKIIRNSFYIFLVLVSLYNVSIFIISVHNTKCKPADWKGEKYISDITSHFEKRPFNNKGARILSNRESWALDISKSRGDLRNGYWFIPYSTKMDFLYITNINFIDSIYDDKDILLKRPFDRNELFLNSNTKKSLIKEPFYVFRKKYEDNYGTKTLEKIQFEFVKKHNISFIAISKQMQLPDIFNQYIDTVFTDKKTKEQFVFLTRLE